jgi:hypothetical protein
MSEYIKLTAPPVWVVKYPECGSCSVELDTDGDGWLCTICGSSWPMNADDGEVGMLYEDWSGETLDGEPLSEDEAFKVGMRVERERREAYLTQLRAKP